MLTWFWRLGLLWRTRYWKSVRRRKRCLRRNSRARRWWWLTWSYWCKDFVFSWSSLLKAKEAWREQYEKWWIKQRGRLSKNDVWMRMAHSVSSKVLIIWVLLRNWSDLFKIVEQGPYKSAKEGPRKSLGQPMFCVKLNFSRNFITFSLPLLL